LAYVRGAQHSNDDEGWGEELKHRDDEGRGEEFEHTVVITTEMEPNFTSGEAAFTPDEGFTWVPIPGANGYWAVAFANPHAGWFVGNNGQILKISF
jgi:hypothetical protein